MIRVTPADEIQISHLCYFMSWNYFKSQFMVFSPKIRFNKNKGVQQLEDAISAGPKAIYCVHHFL